jgi:hypothetical protein
MCDLEHSESAQILEGVYTNRVLESQFSAPDMGILMAVDDEPEH